MPVNSLSFTQLLAADLQRLYDMRFRKEPTWALIGPVVCIKETERALLVRFEGTETWVPKSQLHEEENEVNEAGDMGMLVIPEWLAAEKGWL